MLELRRFQDEFGAALARREPDTSPADAMARALRIHRNTATKAVRDALAANYPVVRWLFGEEPFTACAAAFHAFAPLSEAGLNSYGAGFAAFLASYPPAAEALYAPNVAALERLCTEAYFAADARALDGDDLTAILASSGAVRLHPAARFEAFAWPAISIWRAHQEGDDAALGAIAWQPETALVTRPADDVRVRPLPPGGLDFLAACAAGQPLSVAAAAAASAGADVALLFSDLINAGAFA